MPSPFPGMNPYLENPNLWSEVHHRLITASAIALGSQVRPKYRAAIEKRVYLCDTSNGKKANLVGIPDVSITGCESEQSHRESQVALSSAEQAVRVTIPIPQEAREGYIEIIDVENQSVVTVIEILSPTNKLAGVGRDKYEKKRREILSSPINLVEIDLLRSGKAMSVVEQLPQSDYRLLVAPGNQRPHADLYSFSLQQEIPILFIPLRYGDLQPKLDLQSLLHEVYDQAALDLTINYAAEPVPQLHGEKRLWLDDLLKQQRLR
ncbi:MAG: DUF4058 family protein [Okeania sp. SIO2D1]|nr:DUF4058 family protein [Okeania sp. SIO2D1]